MLRAWTGWAVIAAATALVAGCGGNAGSGSASAPACPARLPARSTLAPGPAAAQRVTGPGRLCLYARSRLARQVRVPGAPLRRVLGAAPRRRPTGIACTAIARLPAALVAGRAIVVLDLSGCPSVLLPDGNRGTLAPAAAAEVLRSYAAAR